MGKLTSSKASGNEHRNNPLRRQVNEAFCGPDGRVSITKTIAVFAQIVMLYHFGRTWDVLIDKPETLLIALAFLVAPDVIKKIITLKYR